MIKTHKDSRIKLLTAPGVIAKQMERAQVLQLEKCDGGYFMVEYLPKKAPTGRELMMDAGYTEGVAINPAQIPAGDDEWLRIFTSRNIGEKCQGVLNARVLIHGVTGTMMVKMEQVDTDGETLGAWSIDAEDVEALAVVIQEIREDRARQEAVAEAFSREKEAGANA